MRALLLPALFLVACGGDAATNQGFGDLAVVTSQEGLSIQVRSSPSPPVRGVDTFELTVTKDARPIDGLALAVEPWMASHGHGSSVKPTISSLGSGKYLVENVSLFMPGRWELRVTGTESGSDDHATIAVDVP